MNKLPTLTQFRSNLLGFLGSATISESGAHAKHSALNVMHTPIKAQLPGKATKVAVESLTLEEVKVALEKRLEKRRQTQQAARKRKKQEEEEEDQRNKKKALKCRSK